jgi:Zn-dependent protease
MLSWSFNLFRIRGIQLSVHVSFLLLLGYFGYEGYMDGGLVSMLWSMATLVAFFVCVVLHELGHSFTGRHFGVNVPRILLTPLGGMAQFDAIPRQPRQEFLITIAGPAVNFAIAAALYFPVQHMTGGNPDAMPGSFSDIWPLLLIGNIYMGCFNLLPAYPMDGGRLLRAFLATRMSYLKATYWACTVSKVVAGLGIAYGLYVGQYMIPAILVFISIAAENEYRAIRRREMAEAHWREMLARMPYAGTPPTDEPPVLGR